MVDSMVEIMYNDGKGVISMKNDYEINGTDTIIELISKGEVFECVIDTDDLEKVKQYSWHKNTKNYVVHKNKENIYIHRFIMDCPKGLFVDHIDGNPLNNRKSNLRIVTTQQNAQNRALMPNNKTGYRGVYFETQTSKYRVQLVIDGVTMDFGRYDDVDTAGYVSGQIIKNFMPYANEER
jgi:hypothetical protein